MPKRKIAVSAAVFAALALTLLAPSPAQAWWARVGGGWVWRPAGVAVVAPPPVVVGPPVVYASPPVAYAPPPVVVAPYPRRWVPAHYDWRGAWVPGHWP